MRPAYGHPSNRPTETHHPAPNETTPPRYPRGENAPRAKKPTTKTTKRKQKASTDPTGDLIARLLTGPATLDGQPTRVVTVGGGMGQPLTPLLEENGHTRKLRAADPHLPERAPGEPPPAEEGPSAQAAQPAPTQPAGGTP